MKKNFYRVVISILRTIIGFDFIRLAALSTDTPAICKFLAEHGIESDLTPIIVWLSSMPITAILGIVGVILVSPLAVLLVIGLLQQEFKTDYRPTKRIFHQMKELFIW